MERYVFKIKSPGGLESGKWIKMFLSTEEVSSLMMELLLGRIQERFPGLRRRKRKLERIALEVNKMAFTLPGFDTAKSQQHLLLNESLDSKHMSRKGI